MTYAPTSLAAWRREVSDALEQWRADGVFTPACDSWLRGFDRSFSRRLAARGWLGLTWPVEYGGAARSAVDRLVLTEELLRVGAPVAAHWMADRQIGPAVLRFGTDEQRRQVLPPIAAGEATWCLGMSEPDSGSDLASVRTTARRTDDGWTISGAKVWTSNAHRADHAYVLARTGTTDDPRAGLSEFLVPLDSPGITVRPIVDLAGEHHFNEVFLDDVVVPADALLGVEGEGWAQVTAQLAHERGGMERVLSTYPLLVAALADHPPVSVGDRAAVGRAVARMWGLRRLAVLVARESDAGAAPGVAAAVLKDLGTAHESRIIDLARDLSGVEADPARPGVPGLLAQAVVSAPGFTIRGGTSEVLRSIVARGASGPSTRSEMDQFADEVLADWDGTVDGAARLWQTVLSLGWTGVGVDEDRGGSGGTLHDLTSLLVGVGRHGVPLPLTETAWATWLCATVGADLPTGTATVALAADGTWRDGRLTADLRRVPWGAAADTLVVVVRDADGRWVAVRPGSVTGWIEGRDLYEEPRDDVVLDGVEADLLGPVDPATVSARLRVLRAAELVGALTAACRLSLDHAAVRTQFGRPIRTFQAVGAHLARMVGERELALAALGSVASAEGEPTAARAAGLWSVVVEAAGETARSAHQVHGAVGTTREHALHRATRRIWARRDEAGGVREAESLVWSAVSPDEHALWQWLTEE